MCGLCGFLYKDPSRFGPVGRMMFEMLGPLDRRGIDSTGVALYGQPQDPAFYEAQKEFAARHPWFRVERVPAQTHFSMVETAKEASAAIEAFVATT